MFKDECRFEVWEVIRQQGLGAFASKLSPALLSQAATIAGKRVVQSPLCLANLAWLGIASAIQTTSDFGTVLTTTLKILQDQQGFAQTDLGKIKNKANQEKRKNSGKGKRNQSKHDPYRNDPTEVNEEAFAQARQRMPLAFWACLIILLGEKFQEEHASLLKFRGFRLLAMDGTCIELENWKKLRDHFGTAKNAGGQKKVQARMVMLQFPHARLPYRYELCPFNQGEVSIARRLSQHLQRNDLVLVDACFWSYGLFCDIQNRGAYFALPMKGKKIALKQVCRLGKGDNQVEWAPKDSRGNWRKEGLPKSIKLRVITYQLPGYRAQKLVTNVLSASSISREDWIRLTTECSVNGRLKPGLMHRRWEIETTYRELKVDQGMEKSLRSRTPESIQYEVAGHVVLYLLVRWLMVEAAVKRGIDPLRLSFSHAMRELQSMQVSLVTATPAWAKVLLTRLLERIAEHQVPYRPGRTYARQKQSSNYRKEPKPPNQNRKTNSTTRNKTQKPRKRMSAQQA